MGTESRLKAELKRLALGAASSAGVAGADILSSSVPQLENYIARGLPPGLGWLARAPRRRADIRSFFPKARSVLMCAFCYGGPPPAPLSPGELERITATRGGRNLPLKKAFASLPSVNAARYFLLRDYHAAVKAALEGVLAKLRENHPETEGRVFCDDSPVLEKALAVKAGLGWVGKNTLLITPRRGSFVVLGGIALSCELGPDTPCATGGCGRCENCLRACPSGALEPYVLNPARCASYWTTLHKGELPPGAAEICGQRAAGCDICQDACPFNAGTSAAVSAVFEAVR
ncbi:MAG: DUF1730 domain-containing protein [Elusimicrobiales bacterium]|nr:DUF1730 domain-containing protein [Elusimicrobiales bacterium]